MNTLSVVIPSKNFVNLRASVAALHDANQESKLIIVDDGISESGYHRDSGEYNLGACLDGSTIVPGVKPFCFSSNVNIGIREALSDENISSVVLLNDDALLKTPSGFTLLQQCAEAHPEYGIISAATNNVGNVNQYLQRGGGLREDPRMVCFVCVLIPRRTIDLIGDLDTRFYTGGFEDDDYCVRIRQAGLKIGIFDGTFVDHYSLTSTFRGPGGPGYQMEIGAKIFKEKWGTDNRGV